MSIKSSHSTRLSPKILGRAKMVLGSLLGLVIILLCVATYQGIVSGELDRLFLQPFRQFSADLQEAMQEPTPMPTQVVTPSPVGQTAPLPTTASAVQYKAPVANCTRYNIREGEFTSNKCYTSSDYNDLVYYLNRYSSAQFSYNSAVSSMNITCSGSEFFKASCERDQTKKTNAENDMNNYKGIIHAIIGRGK